MKPYDLPDQRGHFGPYGGIFVAETLMHALEELRDAYAHYQNDPEFVAEFHKELKHYVGRPSPIITPSAAATGGGAQIYLKREDLNHTGAPGSTRDQSGAARQTRGKPPVIAGPAQASTASRPPRWLRATACSKWSTWGRRMSAGGRQRLSNEAARRRSRSGRQRLAHAQDALNEAMRDWVTNVEDTFYHRHGRGPHPYPMMVRDFQLGRQEECLQQMQEQPSRQRLRAWSVAAAPRWACDYIAHGR
jgi:tryptophan synthase beta chain